MKIATFLKWLQFVILLSLLLSVLSSCVLFGEPPAVCVIETWQLNKPYLPLYVYYSWSPSGELFSYTNEAKQLLILDATGIVTEQQPLFVMDDVAYNTHAWSPDSTRLVFTSWQDYRGILSELSLRDLDLKQLTPESRNSTHPVWIPGTNTIVFSENGDLTALDLITGKSTTVEEGRHINTPLYVARDGSKLISEQHQETDWSSDVAANARKLLIISLENYQSNNLTDLDGCEFEASWSPDSSFVVFSSNHNGDLDLFTSKVGPKATTTNLTDTRGVDEYEPAWSPDGQKIAFTRFRPPASPDEPIEQDIYLLNVNDGTTQNITNTADLHEYQAVWSPDGSKLAFTSESETTLTIDVIDVQSGKRSTIVDLR
jgi:TolB protein